MENEKRYLFNIISAVLKGSAVPFLMDGLDYGILFEIAEKQTMTNILCAGLRDIFLPEKIKAMHNQSLKKQKKSFAEYEGFVDFLCEKGIKCLPVGGVALRGLYANPFYRESRDYDILIYANERDSALSAAEKYGFSVERECLNCDYLVKGGCRVALRTDYYGLDVWEKAVYQKSCLYAMSAEDRYICALYTLKKAIDENRGQVKLLTDVFVLNFAFDGIFDRDYIKGEAERLCFAELEGQINEMYRSLFLEEKDVACDNELVEKLFSDFPRKLPPRYLSPEKLKAIKRIKNVLFTAGAVCFVAIVVAMIVFFDNNFSMTETSTSKAESDTQQSEEISEEASEPFVSYNDGLYYGNTADGLPDGNGKMVYNSGDVYEGGFTKGVKNGYGVLSFHIGGRYEGNFDMGVPNGEGTLYYASGDVLSGEFTEWTEDWRATGECKFMKKNDDGFDTYTGRIVEGKLDGNWTVAYADGDSYSGEIKAGKKNGNGTYVWVSDTSPKPEFTGSWENDVIKEGEYKDSLGTYIGAFLDGKFSGNGKYVYANGDVYEGEFEKGLPSDDNGVLKYKKGGKYEGRFSNGLFHGTGTLTYANGDKVTGTFSKGLLQGEARFYYHDKGLWQTVVYKDGKIKEYKDTIK